MLRRAASGHIEAMQLSKFAAASRMALAVINGWPEAPSSPLHGCGAPLVVDADGAGAAGWVWLAFEDGPPKMLPRKSSGPPLDCARASPAHSSIAARSTVPARRLAGFVAGRLMSHPKRHSIAAW